MDSILLVEDRVGLRQVYTAFLKKLGYGVCEAGSVDEADNALEHHQFSLILSDYMLPGATGLDFLKSLREKECDCPVILMTAFGEVRLAVEAMRCGAFDFMEKPIDLEHLKLVIERALEHRGLKRRQHFDQAREEEEGVVVVGESLPLKAALALAAKVAPSDTNCLLLGESGVGKEVFAQYIHSKSTRTAGPMITVNCASIPAELMESELFGHEKGAFTGAIARKIGLVEVASGGTLFLDEIGELPFALQPKLLRVIQTHEFFRVGSNRLVKSNLRLVCATNRNLKNGVREGWFREDLYYRLAVFPIEIPPLRTRLDDLDALIPWFLKRFGHPRPDLDPGLLTQLKAYPWPGNVRELENVLERGVILSGKASLERDHFPDDLFRDADLIPIRLALDLNKDFKQNMCDWEPVLEQQMIKALLREERGNRERVASRMGVSIKTLYNKITRYDIGK